MKIVTDEMENSSKSIKYIETSENNKINGINRNQGEIVSVWTWVGISIIALIPIVNLIMYLIWALSGNTNKNIQNFARASFLVMLILFLPLILIVLYILYGNL